MEHKDLALGLHNISMPNNKFIITPQTLEIA